MPVRDNGGERRDGRNQRRAAGRQLQPRKPPIFAIEAACLRSIFARFFLQLPRLGDAAIDARDLLAQGKLFVFDQFCDPLSATLAKKFDCREHGDAGCGDRTRA